MKEGLVNYGHCLVKGFMPKETFCIKGVVQCYLFMRAHDFSHCSCGDISLYIVGDTSSHSCSAFAKMIFWAQKGGEKMFCHQIVFIHLCICMLAYVYVSLPFSFSHSHVNIVLFMAKDTSSRSYWVPFIFIYLFFA